MPFATQMLPPPPPAGAPALAFQEWSNTITADLNAALTRGWELRQIVSFAQILLAIFFHN